MTAKRDSTPYGIVYLITNKVSGKMYVGQTIKTISQRWKQHVANKGLQRALSCAIRKYGQDGFLVESIASAGGKEELNALEFDFVESYKTLMPFGYNMKEGGGSSGRLCDSVLKRIVESRAGYVTSEETKIKQSLSKIGKLKSAETKLRMSEANKKRLPISEETRAKMYAKSRANPKTKQSILDSNNRYRARIASGLILPVLRGPMSDAHKIAISEACKGKSKQKRSAEHCRLLSEVKKKYYADKKAAQI